MQYVYIHCGNHGNNISPNNNFTQIITQVEVLQYTINTNSITFFKACECYFKENKFTMPGLQLNHIQLDIYAGILMRFINYKYQYGVFHFHNKMSDKRYCDQNCFPITENDFLNKVCDQSIIHFITDRRLHESENLDSINDLLTSKSLIVVKLNTPFVHYMVRSQTYTKPAKH
jgi:hypothetical protein